jgi:transposase-like protein
MENMARQPPAHRSFTSESKGEIVKSCRRGDRSVGQVARDFDLTETAVQEWLKQADPDANPDSQPRPTGGSVPMSPHYNGVTEQ